MKRQAITSLPPSPEQERRRRMIKYSITMGIRVICLALMLIVQGWWLIIFATGAIILPYFAVVIANVGTAPRKQKILRPGTLHTINNTPQDPE
jgi:hypothetical protein